MWEKEKIVFLKHWKAFNAQMSWRVHLDRAVREQNLSAIPAILFISIFWSFLFQRVIRVQKLREILGERSTYSFCVPHRKVSYRRVLCRTLTHGYGACRVLLLEDKIWETFIIAMCSGMRSPDLHLGLSTVCFYEVLLWNDFCTAYKSFYSKV